MKASPSISDTYFMTNFNSYNSIYEINNLLKRRPGSISVIR